jgi:1-acyl-sn-glycerol-3-phosphate acyltransferase
MMERFVIALIHTIANTFFRRIDVVGIEHVPKEGPVIFAGNHPNALMDGWLLTAKCGRWPLHFMANAKLWEYRFLALLLDAMGAVPVYRHEEHKGKVDNKGAFDRFYEVIESGNCMGIFPEGVSHVESQLTKLKTGAARIALSVAARGKVKVTLVPCGLNYMHRHRFRSQVLIEFGRAVVISEDMIADFVADEQAAVIRLTEQLTDMLREVTLNAPNWRTLRFVQTARRLYKPGKIKLTPSEYVELNRRFVATYLSAADNPGIARFRDDAENYQSRLDILGLKDHQLRDKISVGRAFRRLLGRSIVMMLLLPIAIPGALLHLPVGWVAAIVGEKFSYEMDDVATLKVFSTIALLPVLYLAIAIVVGHYYGIVWALLVVVGLFVSFSVSVWLIEAEAFLLASMVSILRRTRMRAEIEDLRAMRADLVLRIRSLADQHSDPEKPRIFEARDFGKK